MAQKLHSSRVAGHALRNWAPLDSTVRAMAFAGASRDLSAWALQGPHVNSHRDGASPGLDRRHSLSSFFEPHISLAC